MTMRFLIDGDIGRVTHVRLHTMSYVGTGAGKCAARIIRGARFPSFSGKRQAVEYAFQLG